MIYDILCRGSPLGNGLIFLGNLFSCSTPDHMVAKMTLAGEQAVPTP